MPGLCWALGTRREIRTGLCRSGAHFEKETVVLHSTMSCATLAGCLRRDSGEVVQRLEPKHSSKEEEGGGLESLEQEKQ